MYTKKVDVCRKIFVMENQTICSLNTLSFTNGLRHIEMFQKDLIIIVFLEQMKGHVTSDGSQCICGLTNIQSVKVNVCVL